MKIIIFGASGLIGQAMVKALLVGDARITVVGRDADKLKRIFQAPVRQLTWDLLNKEILADQEIAINLTGENIAGKRWTAQQKKLIIESRVEATVRIARYCAELGAGHAPRLLNASAVGIYGLQSSFQEASNRYKNEDSLLPFPPRDFLSKVASLWEDALSVAEKEGVPVVKLRFGVVLSQHGGALKKMLPSFRLNLGAILGSGQQPFSWVALADVVSAILFILQHPELTGAVNIVAPEVVPQKEFANTLANVLEKYCFLKIPSKIVQLMFGEMGDELLLHGQTVASKRLIELGFKFQYPTLKGALRAVLK